MRCGMNSRNPVKRQAWAAAGVALLLVLAAARAGAQNETQPVGVPPESAAVEPLSAPLESLLAGEASPKSLADLRAMQEHFRTLGERVKRATVGIECQGAQGSGVLISRDGLILTAAHVISRPGLEARITLHDGRQVQAVTKGLNHTLDSGLLQVTDSAEWDYLDLGESGSLQLGQWVMAVGHPGGYQETRGVVVRVGRVLLRTSRVVRSDCTLVGGDSGGPLVDMNGLVVAIHSRIGAKLSDNLHVPVDLFADEWDRLETGAEIGGMQARPHFGFRLVDDGGLTIESVSEGGPADAAGMQAGDVIVAVNGKELTTREQLWLEVMSLSIGSEVDVRVRRGSDTVTLKLVAGRGDD